MEKVLNAIKEKHVSMHSWYSPIFDEYVFEFITLLGNRKFVYVKPDALNWCNFPSLLEDLFLNAIYELTQEVA